MKKYILITLSVLLLLGIIVIGLWLVGSPVQARFERLDAQRMNNLQMIAQNIVEYWQAKDKLPEKLDQLNDSLRGISVPSDPETGVAYEYAHTSDVAFKLCATFRLQSKDEVSAAAVPYYTYPIGGLKGGITPWTHPAGHFCFDRSIDKDFFKNQKIPQPVY